MNRALLIGCSGAGKSVFARQLAQATDLPLIHLDKHCWQPGWIKPDKAVWVSKVEALLAEPCWIMDGNYNGTLTLRLACADTVILLDLSRWLCLWRVLKRTVRYLGRTRDDMPLGCYERFDLGFLWYVWTFPRKQRPRILADLSGFDGAIIQCRTRAEVANYLASVGPALDGAGDGVKPSRSASEDRA